MKKYCILILILASPMISNTQNNLTINQLTKNIYHRFYLINRLTPTLELICSNKNSSDSFCFDSINEDLFKHPDIQKAARNIIQQKKLSFIIDCWNHFCTYRFINDPLFEPEFIQLVLMTCHSIDPDEYSCKGRDAQGFMQDVDTDEIANTFYTVKRLKKPVEVICQMWDQSEETSKELFEEDFFNEIKECSHVRIQQCIQDIQQSFNFDPIKSTFQEFAQYRYAGDDSFLREQLSLLFFAYKLMLNKKLSDQTEHVIMHEMESIQYISKNIDDFSIDQILITIDLMTDKLSTIHNLQKSEYERQRKLMYLLAVPVAIIISTPIIYYITKS